MSESGYLGIEPIGGSSDGGRDALHKSIEAESDVTIFAYSVRADWRAKLLQEDCRRIRDEGHDLTRVVFATTATISASGRDSVTSLVLDEYGWDLEIYSIERLRVLLAGKLRHLLAKHPAIFCPPFFPTRGGLSIAESRDTIVLDHVESEHAPATWLSQQLQLAGYRTWSYGTAPLAGESADETVRMLIANRAVRYIPLLSLRSTTNADFIARCTLAANTEGMVLPARIGNYNPSLVPSSVAKLTSIVFDDGWSDALAATLKALASVEPALGREHGKAIALRSFFPNPVTKKAPEHVYASVFAVHLPDALKATSLKRELRSDEREKLRRRWAFVEARPKTLLSFDAAPQAVPTRQPKHSPGYLWASCPFEYGKRSTDVVKELIRRSLDVAMVRSGLMWCDNRKVYYFPRPDGKSNHTLKNVHVDGRNARVAVTGERSYGSGTSKSVFHYQLCPTFRPGCDAAGNWWVTLRIYIRVTDQAGIPFEKKAITRRRKKVAHQWWNKQWFARVLGVMQGLSNDGPIRIGAGPQMLSVSTRPMQWECPIAIDYHAVEAAGHFQEEMASARYIEAPADDDSNREAAG